MSVNEGEHIAQIASILLNSDLTISELAFNKGFKDPGTFRRLFKKHTGQTPRQYRNLHQNKNQTFASDNEFIHKLEHIVTNNAFSRLDLDYLASAMFTSKSTFHRKIKKITGKSPQQYVKLLKLEKALAMLNERQTHINDIAFHLGFEDQKYFCRCFKQHHGKTPSSI